MEVEVEEQEEGLRCHSQRGRWGIQCRGHLGVTSGSLQGHVKVTTEPPQGPNVLGSAGEWPAYNYCSSTYLWRRPALGCRLQRLTGLKGRLWIRQRRHQTCRRRDTWVGWMDPFSLSRRISKKSFVAEDWRRESKQIMSVQFISHQASVLSCPSCPSKPRYPSNSMGSPGLTVVSWLFQLLCPIRGDYGGGALRGDPPGTPPKDHWKLCLEQRPPLRRISTAQSQPFLGPSDSPRLTRSLLLRNANSKKHSKAFDGLINMNGWMRFRPQFKHAETFQLPTVTADGQYKCNLCLRSSRGGMGC